MRAKIIALILIASAIPSITKFVKPYLEERLPFEFGLEKIALDMQNDFVNGEMDPSLIENQEFHYIGHGGQAVAFANDVYVLKFFLARQLQGEKRYPIPKPTHWIPKHRDARREKRAKTRLASLNKAMKNTSAAFERIPEKTGIIALHFRALDEHLPTITLIDHMGKKHAVDLNRASFVFQHKAKLIPEKLACSENKEAVIAKLNQFFIERANAGFIDTERSFMINHNYGFLGDTPIQLDVGNIEFQENLKATPDEEIKRMQGLLTNWAKNL
ncbi:MAG TPA: hypothetical protein VLE96_03065 [Chlamydiales bacterium]|nr:hypothetical protein [Chlamydiales bacterium]